MLTSSHIQNVPMVNDLTVGRVKRCVELTNYVDGARRLLLVLRN